VERLGELLERRGVVFEHLPLAELDLRPCRGCFRCFVEGEEACPLDDDARALSAKLTESDAAVFATPVYSMHVSYLLKTFVDRFAYRFHRPAYFGKYAVGLAATGGMGLKEALAYIRMFAGTWGFEYVDGLRYVDPPRGTRLRRMVKEPDRTEDVASRLVRLLETRPPRRLAYNDYLHFHAMRAVYSRAESFLPTDHAYWREKGWLDPEAAYFTTHVRGNPVLGAAARAVAWMLGKKLDRSEDGDR
jgi:multimeric flavodoxin WrbA